MKGLYLAAYRAYHPNHEIVYQDINGLRDLAGDMLDTPLEGYDYFIASPPCNWWSKANYRRNESDYSLSTRHLLPCILLKLLHVGKPFLVENVRNLPLQASWGLFDLPLFVYDVGRHTYWSNVLFPAFCKQDDDSVIHHSSANRQGGKNVHGVVEEFILFVEGNSFKDT